eukprot:5316450-Amphidinium_carterae.1
MSRFVLRITSLEKVLSSGGKSTKRCHAWTCSDDALLSGLSPGSALIGCNANDPLWGSEVDFPVAFEARVVPLIDYCRKSSLHPLHIGVCLLYTSPSPRDRG